MLYYVCINNPFIYLSVDLNKAFVNDTMKFDLEKGVEEILALHLPPACDVDLSQLI